MRDFVLTICVVCLLFGVCAVACSYEDDTNKQETPHKQKTLPKVTRDDIFVTIIVGKECDVVYDKETMVEYIKSPQYGGYTYTMLADSTGKPKLYKK